MTYVLEAAEFVPVDREEQIREAVWEALVRVDITHQRPDQIAARCAFDLLGSVTVCSVLSNATTIRRSPSLVKDGATAHMFLGLQATGSSMVVQDGRHAILRPGEMALYDTTRPYMLLNDGGISHHYFRIPRAELALPDHLLTQLTAVRLDPDAPTTRLLSGYLTQLIAQARGPAGGDLRAVDTPTIELVRAAMTTGLPDGHVTRQTMHDTRELRIKQYLEQHLGEVDLDAARIAAAHHISVRHLYTLLARMDISLGEWLRTRRLEKARLDLAGREAPSATVAAIARRWGFADPTHFSRVFRAAYGMSPREWRTSQQRPAD